MIVGSLAALYGAIGSAPRCRTPERRLADPRNSRPNPILLRVRGLLIVAFGGVAVLGLTIASVLVSNTTLIAWFEGSPCAGWPVSSACWWPAVWSSC